MKIYRICKRRHAAAAFNGEGARHVAGRWHHAGTPVVYCSENLALATLETLAHATADVLRIPHVWFEVAVPDAVSRRHVAIEELPARWSDFPQGKATRDLGTAWAEEQSSALLSVPSALLPLERTWLVNPAHPDFRRLQISEAHALPFDARFLEDETKSGQRG